MVGVPGRSKACATCRRRKKGCDLKRPACTQCRRAGLECGGYERGRIFVHSTQHHPPSFISRESSSTPGSSSDSMDGILALSFSTVSGEGGYYSPGRQARQARSISTGSNGSNGSYGSNAAAANRTAALHIVPVRSGAGELQLTGAPRSDSCLLGSAREENMLATFWQSYLPNSTLFPKQAAGYASGGWTNVVQSLYRQDRVLHFALMANCFSAIARLSGSRTMADRSLCAHGHALRELRLALDHPRKARSDTVLSALRLMIVFSMFFPDRYEGDRMARAVGWREHNLGVLALLQARGPEAHVTGDGHQMFVDCRLALIVSAIRNRKRSPLNSHLWMTIPWREIPKTPKDRLVDIMSGIPSILEGIDWLEKLPGSKGRGEFHRKIVNSCWSHDRQLSTWYETNVPTERLQALEMSESDGPLSTEDLSVVYIMITFYTACLLLYSAMRILGITDLPPRSNLVVCVRKIGRYLKFFFHPSTGQYGLEMTSFPLGICLQTLYSNPHNTDKCDDEKAVFKELVETDRGREIMEFVGSMLKSFPV